MYIRSKSAAHEVPADFSSRSEAAADILPSFEQISDTRDHRVREIKESIEAGTYTIEPRKLAGLILKSINNTEKQKINSDRAA